ncbi:amidohydrolase family protein [Gynurincola endophyticus]|uniref:amidohydrolase family protein n=1 Tax=Gynurincola endophyticus TaxID=2479004 RepID=UPI000F8CD8D8|nr:amidohydrolase family protein [Gynurincola endophyticus]
MSVRLLQGEAIFDGKNLLPGDFVLVVNENGEISDLRPAKNEDQNIEKWPGILVPGMVNTHCHLELSHMKGVVPRNTGMVNFLLTIVQQRVAEQADILKAAGDAAQIMFDQGISVVGDICNTGIIQTIARKSPLRFYHFVEVIGFDPSVAENRFNFCRNIADGYSTFSPSSVVPHAPYSVSPTLYQLINQQIDSSVLSIHHAESKAEQDFFRKRESDFDRLHQFIKTDLSQHIVAENASSVRSFLSRFTNKKILLVHNVTISEADLIYIRELEKENNLEVYFAICIRANEYIGNGFPDIELLFRYYPDRITIGTDSLASNEDVNLMHELILLKKLYPAITDLQWLKTITIQGAKALNYDQQFGSFETGKKPGIVYVNFDQMRSERII